MCVCVCVCVCVCGVHAVGVGRWEWGGVVGGYHTALTCVDAHQCVKEVSHMLVYGFNGDTCLHCPIHMGEL